VLVAIADQSDTHRDLRIAAGRAVRGFLDEEGAWSALGALLSSGPDEARSLLETLPAHIARRHRSRFGGLVIEVTALPDQLVRQEAFGRLSLWAAWRSDAGGVAAACIANLDSGPAWKTAAGALVDMFGDGLAGEATVDLVSMLASRPDADDWDAGVDRDRPSRQRLRSVVDRLVSLPAAERGRQGAELVRCADGLLPEVTLIPQETRLRLAGIDWTAPARTCRAIAERLSGHLVVGHNAAALMEEALHRDAARWSAADLEEACDELIVSREPNAALLALAIVAVAGGPAGWSETWRSRLRRLRTHLEPDVAGAAQGVFCAAE
jgi:hypothetical protein